MALKHVFEEATKATTRFAAEYAEGRSRQPALAPYDEAPAVLAALDPGSGMGSADRAAIVGALLCEHRREAHPLWQSMLLAAFEPMLRRLRHAAGPKGDPDLDQEVVYAFLQALGSVSTDSGYAPRALRWATRGVVLDPHRAARRGGRPRPFHDEEYVEPFADGEAAAAERLARLFAGAGIGGELAEMLLATIGGDEPLKDYADRRAASQDDRRRAAAYDRLVRDRLRAVARIRTRAGHASAT